MIDNIKIEMDIPDVEFDRLEYTNKWKRRNLNNPNSPYVAKASKQDYKYNIHHSLYICKEGDTWVI